MISNISLKIKRHVIPLSACLMAIIISASSFSVNVHAAPSWVRAGEADVYGNTGLSIGETSDDGEDAEQDSIIKHANKFLLYIEDQGQKLKGDTSEFSLDGIVFGRLAGNAVSYAKFELYDGNPYGVIGAYGYRLFRNVIYGMMAIYFLIILIQQLTGGGAKKRAELKDVVYNLIFIFFMLNFMPVIINMFTVLRDELISILANALGIENFSGLHEVLQQINDDSESKTFVTSMMGIAYWFAPLFYLGSYVTNSLLATGFFIMFPVILLRSMKNKTIFSAWCGNFFSYLVVPFIDFVFLMVPLIMKPLILDTGIVGNPTYMIICILCIWGVIPVRNGLMRFVGNSIGIAPSNGAGALMGMAMMAMRMGGSRGGSSSGGGEKGGFFSDLANANKYDALASNMDAGMKEATMQMNGIGGLDELMKGEKSADTRIAEIFSDNNEDILGQGASATLAATEAEEAQDALAATAGGIDELTGAEAVSNMEMEEPLEGVEAEALSASSELEAGVPAGFEVNDADGIPTTADGTPLKEDAFDMSEELVMPDTNVQREQLENARLENLDRMDKAQEYMDYQDVQIAKYNSAIGEQVKQGTSYKNTVDALTMSTGQRAEDIASLETAIAKDTKDLTKRTPGSADYSRLQNNIATNKMELKQLNADQSAELAQLKVAKEEYAPYEQRIASLKKEISTAEERKTNAGIIKEQRYQKEKEFANIEKHYGGSGEAFTNKNQYAEAVRNHEIEKKHMTYRNFDSRANLSILSPQEKADFYRKRAYVNAAKGVAGTLAGTGAAYVGASAGLFGGAQATMIGGAGGYMVGKGIASKAITTGENVGDAVSSYNDNKKVDNYFKEEPNVRGERIFKSGGTKAYNKPTKTTKQQEQKSKKTVVQDAAKRIPPLLQ